MEHQDDQLVFEAALAPLELLAYAFQRAFLAGMVAQVFCFHLWLLVHCLTCLFLLAYQPVQECCRHFVLDLTWEVLALKWYWVVAMSQGAGTYCCYVDFLQQALD